MLSVNFWKIALMPTRVVKWTLLHAETKFWKSPQYRSKQMWLPEASTHFSMLSREGHLGVMTNVLLCSVITVSSDLMQRVVVCVCDVKLGSDIFQSVYHPRNIDPIVTLTVTTSAHFCCWWYSSKFFPCTSRILFNSFMCHSCNRKAKCCSSKIIPVRATQPALQNVP